MFTLDDFLKMTFVFLQRFDQQANLYPVIVSQLLEKLWSHLLFLDVGTEKVVNGVAVMLAYGEAVAAHQLAVQQAVHVEGLARVFGAGEDIRVIPLLVFLNDSFQGKVDRQRLNTRGRDFDGASAVGTLQRKSDGSPCIKVTRCLKNILQTISTKCMGARQYSRIFKYTITNGAG